MSDFDAEPKSVPSSQIVTGGARLSPYEDFKLRSLPALRGLWSKLLYVAKLRSSEGKYDHWGHIRIHGEERSQQALCQIHSELYIELLRTPLRELIPEDVTGLEQVAREISAAGDKLVPADDNGGSARHLNSIVLAVHLLRDARLASSRSAA
jgi:hypothetical protein